MKLSLKFMISVLVPPPLIDVVILADVSTLFVPLVEFIPVSQDLTTNVKVCLLFFVFNLFELSHVDSLV